MVAKSGQTPCERCKTKRIAIQYRQTNHIKRYFVIQKTAINLRFFAIAFLIFIFESSHKHQNWDGQKKVSLIAPKESISLKNCSQAVRQNRDFKTSILLLQQKHIVWLHFK